MENFPNSVLNTRRKEKSPKFLLFRFFVPTKQFSQRLEQTNDCPHSEWSFCSLFYAPLKVETKFCLLSSKSQFFASYIEKTFFPSESFSSERKHCGKSFKTNPHLFGEGEMKIWYFIRTTIILLDKKRNNDDSEFDSGPKVSPSTLRLDCQSFRRIFATFIPINFSLRPGKSHRPWIATFTA